MAARPRTKKHRGLPDYLYADKKGAHTYFVYRNPKTGERKSLGKDRRLAILAARQLNARLLITPSSNLLVARVLRPEQTVADFVKYYTNAVLPSKRNRRGKPYSEKTLGEYTRYLALSTERWGPRALSEITRRDVSELLRNLTPNTALHVRSTLHGLFAQAIGEGYLEHNPVEGTLKPQIVVARHRLTKAEVSALRAKAPEWLQLAIDLAVESLQRLSDLTRLTTDDLADGYLYVRQQKTGANVRMPLSDELLQRLPASGPLIRRADGQPVNGPYLSRAFAKARDDAGVHSKLPSRQKGSFHELRAYGGRELEKQNINPQARLGHLDPKSTRTYLDRHKERWIEG